MELGLSLVDNRSNSHNSDSQHDEQHDSIASMRKRQVCTCSCCTYCTMHTLYEPIMQFVQHNENLPIAHPDTVEVVLLSCVRFDVMRLSKCDFVLRRWSSWP
jgi:hypothetical protein